MSDVYLFESKGLLVRLNFADSRILIVTPKMVLTSIDPSNGVEVKFTLGNSVAVENIPMKDEPGDRLVYRRTGVVDEE